MGFITERMWTPTLRRTRQPVYCHPVKFDSASTLHQASLLVLLTELSLSQQKQSIFLRQHSHRQHGTVKSSRTRKPSLIHDLGQVPALPRDRKVKVSVAQSCPTLCNPIDSSLPGSSVHGVSQARTLEWVAISSSRRSS